MSAPATSPSIRSLGATVYAPSFLFAVGQGAVIPIVALAAKDVGASIPVAGLIVALRGIGTMLFDIPAGALIARIGERRAMSVATGMLLVALLGCVVSTSPVPFALSMVLMGCGWSVWLLARLTYISEVMPIHVRGRALSTLGGVNRMGNFVGPFAGALAITTIGIDGAYGVHIVMALSGWVVLLLVPDPHAEIRLPDHGPVRFRTVTRQHSRVFLTAGLGALCIGLLRSSRHAIVPLWGDHIGLSASAVGVVFGIASGMDMLLFYPAGSISDRLGRKFVAIPCLSVLALGFLLLPLTHTFWTIVLVGLVLGFGNGLGSGIVMTLGADFSPARGRAEFLGVWRLIGDLGSAGGPLIAAGVIGAASLGAAAVLTGVIGLAGAVVVLTTMPEPLRRARSTTMEDEAAAVTT